MRAQNDRGGEHQASSSESSPSRRSTTQFYVEWVHGSSIVASAHAEADSDSWVRWHDQLNLETTISGRRLDQVSESFTFSVFEKSSARIFIPIGSIQLEIPPLLEQGVSDHQLHLIPATSSMYSGLTLSLELHVIHFSFVAEGFSTEEVSAVISDDAACPTAEQPTVSVPSSSLSPKSIFHRWRRGGIRIKLAETQADARRLADELDRARHSVYDLSSARKTIASLERQLKDSKMTIEELKRSDAVSRQSIESLASEDSVQVYKRRHLKSKRRIRVLESERSVLLVQVAELEEELSRVTIRSYCKGEVHEIEELQQAFEDAKRRIKQEVELSEAIQQLLKVVQLEEANLKSKVEQLHIQLDTMKEANVAFSSELIQVSKENAVLRAKVEDQERLLREADDEKISLQTEIVRLRCLISTPQLFK